MYTPLQQVDPGSKGRRKSKRKNKKANKTSVIQRVADVINGVDREDPDVNTHYRSKDRPTLRGSYLLMSSEYLDKQHLPPIHVDFIGQRYNRYSFNQRDGFVSKDFQITGHQEMDEMKSNSESDSYSDPDHDSGSDSDSDSGSGSNRVSHSTPTQNRPFMSVNDQYTNIKTRLEDSYTSSRTSVIFDKELDQYIVYELEMNRPLEVSNVTHCSYLRPRSHYSKRIRIQKLLTTLRVLLTILSFLLMSFALRSSTQRVFPSVPSFSSLSIEHPNHDRNTPFQLYLYHKYRRDISLKEITHENLFWSLSTEIND